PFPSSRRSRVEILLASLESIWSVETFTRSVGGDRYEVMGWSDSQITIAGHRWVCLRGRESSGNYRFRIDASRRPAWIDFLADSDGIIVSSGIIRRVGDTLELLHFEGSQGRRPLS